MILVLGGTSETKEAVNRLVDLGYRLLVSTACDYPLSLKAHSRIQWRQGALSHEEMSALIAAQKINAIVDLTHPFAQNATRNALTAAAHAGVPIFCYHRKGAASESHPHLLWADDHRAAADIACAKGRHILSTIGTKHLKVYIESARKKSLSLTARVLDHPASLAACHALGLGDQHILLGKGPFSVEENQQHIRKHDIDVVVTKDSGTAGGVEAKIEATRRENCILVVVRRPPPLTSGTCQSVDELIFSITSQLHPECRGTM